MKNPVLNLINFRSPHTLTLVYTYKCTAHCPNCCSSCKPTNSQKMDVRQCEQWIEEAQKTFSESLRIVVITGGECMIYLEEVLRLIEFCKTKGLLTRIVTNAFWATSYQKAYRIITRLKKAGLTEMNFSTGIEHQLFVPWINVHNASIAAIEHGYKPLINVEAPKPFIENPLKHLSIDQRFSELIQQNLIRIQCGAWMSFTESSDAIKNNIKCSRQKCPNLFNNIVINPFGHLLSCCGLISDRVPFSRMGWVREGNIAYLYKQYFKDLLKIWLASEGPISVLDFIKKKHKISSEIPYGSRHLCDFCREIFINPQNIQTLKSHYEEIRNYLFFKSAILRQPQ